MARTAGDEEEAKKRSLKKLHSGSPVQKTLRMALYDNMCKKARRHHGDNAVEWCLNRCTHPTAVVEDVVVVTQPRRICAQRLTSYMRDVAKESGSNPDAIGFAIGSETSVPDKNKLRILYVTVGWILN